MPRDTKQVLGSEKTIHITAVIVLIIPLIVLNIGSLQQLVLERIELDAKTIMGEP